MEELCPFCLDFDTVVLARVQLRVLELVGVSLKCLLSSDRGRQKEVVASKTALLLFFRDVKIKYVFKERVLSFY